MKEFYEHQRARCLEAIESVEPGTEEYANILNALEIINVNLEPEPGSQFVLVRKDAEPAPVPQEDDPSTPQPEPDPLVDSAISMKKEDVMGILSPLAASGVNVAKVMADMGYHKLSEVPAARYQELVDNARAAKEET